MAQSWNNVLSYIKMGLGAPLNLIELADSDIIDMLKEHIIPYFSQFCPLEKWVFVGPMHSLPAKIGQPPNRFKIPKEVDEPILDILEVIWGNQGVKS